MTPLHLLPRPLARWVVRSGARAIALYNRVFHPRVRGACVFVRHEGRILLVRSTYQSWWGLPGGRVSRGETFAVAALRELCEETGLTALPESLRALGELGVDHNHIHDHVAFFELRCDEEPRVACDGVEIAELRWATADELSTLKLWPPLREWLARRAD